MPSGGCLTVRQDGNNQDLVMILTFVELPLPPTTGTSRLVQVSLRATQPIGLRLTVREALMMISLAPPAA